MFPDFRNFDRKGNHDRAHPFKLVIGHLYAFHTLPHACALCVPHSMLRSSIMPLLLISGTPCCTLARPAPPPPNCSTRSNHHCPAVERYPPNRPLSWSANFLFPGIPAHMAQGLYVYPGPARVPVSWPAQSAPAARPALPPHCSTRGSSYDCSVVERNPPNRPISGTAGFSISRPTGPVYTYIPGRHLCRPASTNCILAAPCHCQQQT